MKEYGNFKFYETGIKNVIIVEPKVFGDHRGYFFETYHREYFVKGGIKEIFVQDNHSKSRKGVLRGLHYQSENMQGKLVRVIKGKVFDVAVDLRKNSETYGKWEGILLSARNKKQFYIPAGFAHGFLVLSNEAEFVYKCTDFYRPNSEGGIMWNDTEIDIEWPLERIDRILLSDKDKALPTLSEAKIQL